MPDARGVETGRRFEALDALRGIAAVVVMFHHCLLANTSVDRFLLIKDKAHQCLFCAHAEVTERLLAVLTYSPLHLFWAGQEAVLLFFVLSGFVLALPFLDGRPPLYGRFLIRRICRIYLPYLAALLGTVALASLLPHAADTSESVWIRSIWSSPFSWTVWRDHLLMLGDLKLNIIDNPVWSLVHEMRISLIFPLLMLVFCAPRIGTAVLVGACVLYCSPLIRWPDANDSFGMTALYTNLFILGIMLARFREPIRRWLAPRSGVVKAALWGMAILSFTANWLRLPSGLMPVSALSRLIQRLCKSQKTVTFGAALLLPLSLHTHAVRNFLTKPPLLWLGRISYSLYLVHVPVIAALIFIQGPHANWIFVPLLAPLLSFALAALFHRLIEEPARQLGYRLSRSGIAAISLPGRPQID